MNAGWGLAAGLALACGGGGSTGPEELASPAGVQVAVTVELQPGLAPFKRDGRLEADYELAPPFAGRTDVGVVVLPAGRRSATRDVRLPELAGTLRVAEARTAPDIPFLCGPARSLDPRVERAVTVPIALCFP